MKFAILAPLLAAVSAGRFVASPVEKVVKMITELKATVEADGKEELVAYDKYACWCEDTLATKAADIAKAKTDIENMRKEYIKLGGELASLEVDIKQIKKDLAENLESQKEAKSMRDKELEAYMEDRTEAENCIGALEAAIKILTNAGTKSTGFLATLEEAQVLSTVGSLRGVLGTRTIRQKVAQKDLDIVRQFIESPDDFLKAKSGMVALQEPKEIKKAPAGYNQDYAPQSGQIQGVLKQMYDDFTGKLEGANVEESKKRKAYEELMEVKVKEQKALEGTLQSSETAQAEKTSEHADTKSMLDLTQEQLEADEEFFAQTKDSCKKKAQSWAQRTRLRAEELQGMTTAIRILSSDDAQKTFENATTTFLQISAKPEANGAYKHLRALADKFGGLALAQVAAEAKAGGHFDKVITMIDSLIRKLKYEGEEDIKARDKCEVEQGRNKKAIEDLNFETDKVKQKLERYEAQKKELQTNIENVQKEIDESNKTITEMKAQRAKEWAEYSQATKDDLEAIQLLTEAIHSLSKFYKDNNIKTTALIQVQSDPEGVGDRPEEAAPETWEDGTYGGKKSKSGGIIAILEMIKEDLESEVKFSGEADAAGRTNFAADLKAAERGMGREMKIKADADVELAEVMRQIGYREEDETSLGNDLDGEEKIKEALEKQCGWVETHFDERARKRKLEIEGLKEARHFLMGAVVLPGKR